MFVSFDDAYLDSQDDVGFSSNSKWLMIVLLNYNLFVSDSILFCVSIDLNLAWKILESIEWTDDRSHNELNWFTESRKSNSLHSIRIHRMKLLQWFQWNWTQIDFNCMCFMRFLVDKFRRKLPFNFKSTRSFLKW